MLRHRLNPGLELRPLQPADAAALWNNDKYLSARALFSPASAPHAVTHRAQHDGRVRQIGSRPSRS